MSKRLESQTNDTSVIADYFAIRSHQAYPYGFTYNNSCFFYHSHNGKTFEVRMWSFLDKEGNRYFSFFVPLDNRKAGIGESLAKELIRICADEKARMLTIPDCDIEKYFKKYDIPYICVPTPHLDWFEYKMMQSHYGSDVAKRTGLFLMNHVDEGICIMTDYKAHEDAIKAFVIHPLIQDDEQVLSASLGGLATNFNINQLVIEGISARVLLLCMEYRKVANAYLCKPETDNWTMEDIKFACPLVVEDVRLMLIADKVQNYKDFLQYHALTHPRRSELFKYFNNWIDYLDCHAYATRHISANHTMLRLPVGVK